MRQCLARNMSVRQRFQLKFFNFVHGFRVNAEQENNPKGKPTSTHVPEAATLSNIPDFSREPKSNHVYYLWSKLRIIAAQNCC